MLIVVRCTNVNYCYIFINMDIKEKFGKKVKHLRLERGWSQEKLAFYSNLDRTYIPNIESGKRNVSISVIEKLSKAFSITISKLLEDL